MEELIELSSDTDSYIEEKDNLTDELSALIKKYENIDSVSQESSEETSPPKKIKVNNDISPSSSETETENDILTIPLEASDEKISENDILSIPTHDETISPKTLKRLEREEKLKRKNEEKAQKDEERKRKKAKVEKEKAEKRALADAFKQMRPEEAIKQVRCLIDNRLSDQLINGLEKAEITCKRIESDHKLPKISWYRQPQNKLIGLDGQLGLQVDDEIMPTIYVIQHNELLNLARSDQILQLAINSKGSITLVEIHGEKPQREEERVIESALTELQIVAGWSHRKIKSNGELIEVVRQYTKSVALAPSKRLKAAAKGDISQPASSDCVRVQNNTGHGLSTLWLRQLTQFPLASLETAHAVLRLYPTPKALAGVGPGKEVIDALADEQVRRMNGPLSAPRRLGRQLANKIHMAFTSRDPHALLT